MTLIPPTQQTWKTPSGLTVDVLVPTHESQFRRGSGQPGQILVDLPVLNAEGEVIGTSEVVWDAVPASWELLAENKPAEAVTIESNGLPEVVLRAFLDTLDTGKGGHYEFFLEGERFYAKGKPDALALLEKFPSHRLSDLTTDAPEVDHPIEDEPVDPPPADPGDDD